MANRSTDSAFTSVGLNAGANVGSTSTGASGSSKFIPKDGQVIMAMMKEVGLQEHDVQALHQLLEFVYRHTTTVLDDARMFANHAKKKNIEIDDVKLAIAMQNDRIFTLPPPRDLILDLAKMKNTIPLQAIKAQAGIRLPPDRYCLVQTNYRLKNSVTSSQNKIELTKLEGATRNIGTKTNKYISPNIKLMARNVRPEEYSIPDRNSASLANIEKINIKDEIMEIDD